MPSDLHRLYTQSGLTVRQFARAVGRDERNIRRCLGGEPTGDTFGRWLASVESIHSNGRRTVITYRHDAPSGKGRPPEGPAKYPPDELRRTQRDILRKLAPAPAPALDIDALRKLSEKKP